MVEILERQDISQQYLNCLVMYKGDPVKVTAIGTADPVRVHIFNLRTQKKHVVEFSLEHFSPPMFRLGMVNTGSGALFISRKPVRRMQVGISKESLNVEHLLDAEYLPEIKEAMSSLSNLNTSELADTISNSYPDFRTCIEYVKEFNTNVAFDKQFAIDYRFRIFYRNRIVGNLPKNCRTVERINFSAGNEHLAMVIGDKCVHAFENLWN